MDAKIIAAFVALVGILISAVFSSAGYYYKNRLEAKKSAKRVLFLLLEFRRNLRSHVLDPLEGFDSVIKRLTTKLQETGMFADDEDIDKVINAFIDPIKQNLRETVKTEFDENKLKEFHSALSELSMISPLLAHYITYHQPIEKLAKFADGYFSLVQSSLVNEMQTSEAKTHSTSFVDESRDFAIGTLLSDLDKQVIHLAKHCSRKDYIRCKKLINRKVEKNTQLEDEIFSKFEQQLLELTNLTVK